jgi:hypothetical protein
MILSLSSGANLACALQLHGEWVIGQFRISAEGHLLDVLLKSVTPFTTATLASAAFQASSINIFFYFLAALAVLPITAQYRSTAAMISASCHFYYTNFSNAMITSTRIHVGHFLAH